MPKTSICQSEFDAALSKSTSEPAYDLLQYKTDQEIQTLFGDDEALGARPLATRWAALMRSSYPRSDWDVTGVDSRHWKGAGQMLRWGLAFQLVTELAGPKGERLWRRVRREPTFLQDIKDPWRVIRIRGLPPEEQAAQYRRERALIKLRVTLDKKARLKADDEIRRIVGELVSLVPDEPISSYLYAVKRRLPEICHDRSWAEVSAMLCDAHHRIGMNRDDLSKWIRDLQAVLDNVRWKIAHPIIRRTSGPGVLATLQAFMDAPPPVAPAILPAGEEAAIPDEDVAALAGLV